MTALFSEDYEQILFDASAFDEYIDRHFIHFQEDEDYRTLFQFFDKENYPHRDIFADEFVQPDTQKLLKKILRGKDTISLIQYALDLGRLVGRAEQILLTHDD